MWTGDCSLGYWSFMLTVSADGDWSRFTRLLVICTYSFSRWAQKTIQRVTGHLYLQFQQMGTGDDSEVTGQLYLQFQQMGTGDSSPGYCLLFRFRSDGQ